MAVRRIVPNIAAGNVELAQTFYGDVLAMDVVMDLGWIMTFGAAGDTHAEPQISVAEQGGSGTQVPYISVEVDNLDEVCERARSSGFAIEYGPSTEPWGVRRFYVRDPFGRLINILIHPE